MHITKFPLQQPTNITIKMTILKQPLVHGEIPVVSLYTSCLLCGVFTTY